MLSSHREREIGLPANLQRPQPPGWRCFCLHNPEAASCAAPVISPTGRQEGLLSQPASGSMRAEG